MGCLQEVDPSDMTEAAPPLLSDGTTSAGGHPNRVDSLNDLAYALREDFNETMSKDERQLVPPRRGSMPA